MKMKPGNATDCNGLAETLSIVKTNITDDEVLVSQLISTPDQKFLIPGLAVSGAVVMEAFSTTTVIFPLVASGLVVMGVFTIVTGRDSHGKAELEQNFGQKIETSTIKMITHMQSSLKAGEQRVLDVGELGFTKLAREARLAELDVSLLVESDGLSLKWTKLVSPEVIWEEMLDAAVQLYKLETEINPE